MLSIYAWHRLQIDLRHKIRHFFSFIDFYLLLIFAHFSMIFNLSHLQNVHIHWNKQAIISYLIHSVNGHHSLIVAFHNRHFQRTCCMYLHLLTLHMFSVQKNSKNKQKWSIVFWVCFFIILICYLWTILINIILQ